MEHLRLLREEVSAAIEAALAPLRSEFAALRRCITGSTVMPDHGLSPLGASEVAAGAASPLLDPLLPLSNCMAGLALSPVVRRLDEPMNEAWSFSAPSLSQPGDETPPTASPPLPVIARPAAVETSVASVPAAAVVPVLDAAAAPVCEASAPCGAADAPPSDAPDANVVASPLDPPEGAQVLPAAVADGVAALALLTVQASGLAMPCEAPLDLFLAPVADAPHAPLLPTPAARKGRGGMPVATTRRSARLDKKKTKAPPGSGLKAVQELIARVCGVLDPSVAYDDKAKKAYLDLFSTPLAAPVVQVIAGLVAHAKSISQKKGKKSKKATLELANVVAQANVE